MLSLYIHPVNSLNASNTNCIVYNREKCNPFFMKRSMWNVSVYRIFLLLFCRKQKSSQVARLNMALNTRICLDNLLSDWKCQRVDIQTWIELSWPWADLPLRKSEALSEFNVGISEGHFVESVLLIAAVYLSSARPFASSPAATVFTWKLSCHCWCSDSVGKVLSESQHPLLSTLLCFLMGSETTNIITPNF